MGVGKVKTGHRKAGGKAVRIKRKAFRWTLATILMLTMSMSSVYATEEFNGVLVASVGNQNSYESSGSSGSSSYGLTGGYYNIGGLGVVCIVVITGVVIYLKRKKGYDYTGDDERLRTLDDALDMLMGRQDGDTPSSMTDGGITNLRAVDTSIISQEDENFSDEEFMAWAKEVFITLNKAWVERDWSQIRVFESDELFKEHSMQLDEYIRKKRVNVLERVAVKDIWISNCRRDEKYEYLTVELMANMVDYIYDEKTSEILAGSENKLWKIKYEMRFMRTVGVKTKGDQSTVKTTDCPNCGAPTSITSAGKCEYCGSLIATGDYNWVLYSYEGQNM